jgi:hypothetical protein
MARKCLFGLQQVKGVEDEHSQFDRARFEKTKQAPTTRAQPHRKSLSKSPKESRTRTTRKALLHSTILSITTKLPSVYAPSSFGRCRAQLRGEIGSSSRGANGRRTFATLSVEEPKDLLTPGQPLGAGAFPQLPPAMPLGVNRALTQTPFDM